jgi:hypothetical protein
MDEPNADPLSAAQAFLCANRGKPEAHALRCALSIIATWRGSFRDAQLWLLGPQSSAILAALIDARLAGRYTEHDWRCMRMGSERSTRG